MNELKKEYCYANCKTNRIFPPPIGNLALTVTTSDLAEYLVILSVAP
ncbi:MAG: hypothetical protein LBK60_06660 [Verrucomicrobiales bacterium]|jgi:hypothetical protein|nr:hypothetical protein [Verrucomicrobiales bacterium]